MGDQAMTIAEEIAAEAKYLRDVMAGETDRTKTFWHILEDIADRLDAIAERAK